MNDTISRQMTIDALKEHFEHNENRIESMFTSDVYWHDDTVLNVIRSIPSAQPDNECEKCVFAPFKQFRQEWIPVSERLPEEYGNYLISTYDGDVDVGTIDPKKKGVWSACDADGFYWLREVLAWMPLPEPYTERREDGENG